MTNEWLRGHYKTDIFGQTSLQLQYCNDGLDLTLRTQVSTWNLLRTEKFPYSATVYGREEAKGDYREDRRNLLDNNTDLLIKFNRKVVSALNVNAIAGGNIRVFNYNSNFTSTNYLNVPGVYTFANSAQPGDCVQLLSPICGYCRPITRPTLPCAISLRSRQRAGWINSRRCRKEQHLLLSFGGTEHGTFRLRAAARKPFPS